MADKSLEKGKNINSGASIAKFAAVVSVFKLVCFVIGFGVKLVFTRVAGTAFTDAFFWAEDIFFKIFSIGEDLLGSSYLPIFVHAKEDKGEKTAWKYSSTVLVIQAIIAVIVTGFCIFFASGIVGCFGADLLEPNLAKNLLIIFLAGLLFYTIASTLTQNLNAYKKFSLAAFSDFSFKSFQIILLLGAIILVPIIWSDMFAGPEGKTKLAYYAMYATAIGYVVGMLSKFVINYWGLRRQIWKFFKIENAIGSPEMKALGAMVFFLLIGSLMGKARDLIELGYKAKVGGVVSYITYAKLLNDVATVTFPFALGVVLFPYLAEAVSKDNRKRLVQLTMNSMRLMFLLFTPIIIAYTIFGTEFLGILFYNKEHLPLDSIAISGKILSIYAMGFFFYIAEIIVLQTFFSYKDAVTPTGVAVFCAIIHIGFLYFFYDKLSYMTFPIAFAISRALKASILFVLLLPRFKGGMDGELHRWGSFVIRAGIPALAGFAAAYGVSVMLPQLAEGEGVKMLCLKRAVIGGTVLTGVTLAGFYLLKVKELSEALVVVKSARAKVAKLFKRK